MLATFYTRYMFFILLFISFTSAALAQVGLPSDNGIYTLEDGKDFIQIWEGYTGEAFWAYFEFGQIYRININSRSEISLVGENCSATFSKSGNLLAHNRWPGDGDKEIDINGNFIFMDRGNNQQSRTFDLHVYSPYGKLISNVSLTGFQAPNYHNFARNEKGEFFFFQEGYGHLAAIYRYSSSGKLLNTVDLNQSFKETMVEAERIYLGPDGRLYAIDKNRNILQIYDTKGYPCATIRLAGLPEGFFWDRITFTPEGNLAFRKEDNNRIYFYSPDGHFIKFIDVAFEPGEGDLYWLFAIDNDGSLVIYNVINGLLYRHDTDGNFVRRITPARPTAMPLVTPLKDSLRMAGRIHHIDRDGNLYVSQYLENPVTFSKFNKNGQLLNAYKGRSFAIWDMEVLPGSSKIIFSDSVNIWQITRNLGKKLLARHRPKYKSTNPRFTMVSDGSYYAIENGNIAHYSPEFELLDIFNKKGNHAPDLLLNARDIQFGPDGLLHVYDEDDSVKVFGFDGNFMKGIDLPSWSQWNKFLVIDKDGQYLVGGKLFNSKGKFLRQLAECQDFNYRVSPGSSRFYRSLNTYRSTESGLISQSYATALDLKGVERSVIKGKLEFAPLGRSRWDPARDLVYLEGTTPKGEKFYSAVEASGQSHSFSFRGIPLGSKYKIYTQHPLSDYCEYAHPEIRGTLDSKKEQIVFKTRLLPAGLIKVKGTVANKYGHPVQGVRVSSGSRHTYTNIHGGFVLALPESQDHTIAVSKDGYQFVKSTRTIQVEDHDYLYLSFQERK